jgi:hypothetical protein
VGDNIHFLHLGCSPNPNWQPVFAGIGSRPLRRPIASISGCRPRFSRVARPSRAVCRWS